MKRMLWFTKSFAVILAALMALAACSPPGGGSGPVASSGSGGGELRYHLYLAPTSFDPFHASNGADGDISGVHFRPLLREVGEGYEPFLAESWTVSPDATIFTFTLRDTKWSDGAGFTSADVVYSLEGYADPDTKSLWAGRLSLVAGYQAFVAGDAETISGITATDERTVVITLAKPNAAFLYNLSGLAIVPKHIYSSIPRAKYQGATEFREPTVGIGPYVFSRWVTDDQVELVPNQESFEPHPLSRINAQFLDGDVARAQLETGEIDIAQLSSADAETLADSQLINVQLRTGLGVMSLYTALASEKLADVRVRQAVLHAIDRKAIVDNVLSGNGEVAPTLLYQPSWAVPEDLNPYPYDPERARALLAEAGWKADTVVNLDIVPGQADRDAVMDIIAGQLRAVGINAKIRQLQPAELTKLVEERKFDLLITILGLPASEPGSINERFLCDGTLNISGYCDKELDALLSEAVSISDQTKRAELYHQANRILNRDQPAMPLYLVNQAWGSTKRVQGFDPQRGGLPMAQEWSVVS